MYYVNSLAGPALWIFLAVGSLIAVLRFRRPVAVLQLIAAILCICILLCDILMFNRDFGLLYTRMIRGGAPLSTEWMAYSYISQCLRWICYAAFAIAFVVDRYTAPRPAAAAGFLPDPPIPQNRS
jgi:hypothetical protein